MRLPEDRTINNFKTPENAARSLAFACIISLCSATVASAQPAILDTPAVSPTIQVTTTESFYGYRIKEYKGIVRGITVREPSPVANFKASLKGLVGGAISPFIKMCEKARQQAMDAMLERAVAAGANAVIGFRYDSSAYGDSGNMGTEVVCYGTAVVIVPETQRLTSSQTDDPPATQISQK